MIQDLKPHRRLAVAPMMELTDRHYRYLARLLTRHTLLYTEMLTCAAVIHGDREYLLGKNGVEDPVVLQLGGSDSKQMASAAQIGEQWGYGEINMNVGCPSDRVKAGRFGACLMAEPALGYEAVRSFVDEVSKSGCTHFIVHARKAWLDGLSPKENRSVPPLRYDYVYRLKQEFPALHISINGGIESLDATVEHLAQVDGVMIGRAAYYHPAMLAQADACLFTDLPDGRVFAQGHEALFDVARQYAEYMQGWMDQGVRLSAMSRHVVSLFQNVPGARLWRRHISEQANKAVDATTLIEGALTHLVLASERIADTYNNSDKTMPDTSEHAQPKVPLSSGNPDSTGPLA